VGVLAPYSSLEMGVDYLHTDSIALPRLRYQSPCAPIRRIKKLRQHWLCLSELHGDIRRTVPAWHFIYEDREASARPKDGDIRCERRHSRDFGPSSFHPDSSPMTRPGRTIPSNGKIGESSHYTRGSVRKKRDTPQETPA